MNFVGWIPTVTGNLSFSAVGESSHPTKTVSTVVDGNILFCQSRDLLDILAPFGNDTDVGTFFQELIANYVVGVSGSFLFCCVGSFSDDRQSIGGKIYVVPCRDNRASIRVLKRKIVSWNISEDHSGSDIQSKGKEIADLSCASADFILSRNGKVYLAVSLLGDSAEESRDLEELLANQIFYFLKDNSHVHQHHDPSHDAITTVSLVADEADNTWAADTQHSLYRAVIRYKRYRNEKALFRAAGILAYARSFGETFENQCGDHLTKFNHDQLSESLSVARDEIKHFDAKRSSFVETIRNFFFAAFGLVISVVLILRLDPQFEIDAPEGVESAALFVVGHPSFIAAIIVISSFGYSVVTHRVDPAQWYFVRAVLRLFQGFRLRWFVVFNCFLTVFLCWLTYRLLMAIS